MLLNQLFQSILVNIDSFFFNCSSVHKAAKRKNLTNISPNHIDLKLVQIKNLANIQFHYMALLHKDWEVPIHEFDWLNWTYR